MFLFAALGEEHAFLDHGGHCWEGYLHPLDEESVLFMGKGPLDGGKSQRVEFRDIRLETASYWDPKQDAWLAFRPEAWRLVATADDQDDELTIERCFDAASLAYVLSNAPLRRVWVAAEEAQAARALLAAAGGE